jgi:predicted nucleotidyltransferase
MVIFRSQLQGEVLARVLLSDQPVTIADLARDLMAPLPTVAREVNRLHTAGVLALNRQGRAQLVTADDSNPAVSPLRELIAITFGPRQIILEEFTAVPGLAELYIFGSWAARFLGEAGPTPADVDVLVVGPADRDEVYDAADRAARRLHRDVNPTVVSHKRWADETDPFIDQLKHRPLLQLLPERTTSCPGRRAATPSRTCSDEATSNRSLPTRQKPST